MFLVFVVVVVDVFVGCCGVGGEDVAKVLADVALEFVGCAVADLDGESISWLVVALISDKNGWFSVLRGELKRQKFLLQPCR